MVVVDEVEGNENEGGSQVGGKDFVDVVHA